MDMLAYLTELIKTRKEVGIPGLGTIYKKKSPGRYDAETHSFLPPSYVLDFSSEVREQALLIDHICKKRNISPDAATYYVDEFSDEIKRQLEEHQEASFYPLGTLYQKSETLSFKPVNDQNFGFDFYGLPPVKEEADLLEGEVEIPPYSPEPVIEAPQLQDEDFVEEIAEQGPGEEQLNLENSNADLRDAEEEIVTTEPPVIEEVATSEKEESLSEEQVVTEEFPVEEVYEVEEETQPTSVSDEQIVYEEIAEVEFPAKPVEQPVIETVIPTTINDTYAQSNRPVYEPRPVVLPEPAAEREPVADTGFYNSNGEYTEKASTPVYLKILIALLLILIGLAAAYFIRPDLFDPILKRGQSSTGLPAETGTNEQNLNQTTDSLSQTKGNELPDSTKKDTAVNTKPAGTTATTTVPVAPKTTPAPIPAVSTETTYEVIGSSVSSQREAERFIANMKSIGVTAKAIPPAPGKKKIKISIATFKDYASADAERPKLEKKLGIKDLYIHTNKPL